MNNGPNEPNLLQDARKSMDLGMWVATCLAIPLETLLHVFPGVRYPGWPGVLVLLVVPIMTVVFPYSDPRPLLWFFAAYLVVIVGNRIQAVSRFKRGLNNVHSYYDGFPMICRIFPKLSERTAKRIVEPLIVIIAGLLCTDWNSQFAIYLFLGGFSLCAVNEAAEEAFKKRTLDLHDTMVGQQLVAEWYRDQHARTKQS